MPKKMKAGSDSVQRISNFDATTSSLKQHISYFNIAQLLVGPKHLYKTIKSLAARNNSRATTIQTNSYQYGEDGAGDETATVQLNEEILGKARTSFCTSKIQSMVCFLSINIKRKIKRNTVCDLCASGLGSQVSSGLHVAGIRDAGHGR